MTSMPTQAGATISAPSKKQRLDVVRREVRKHLLNTPAYRALPQETQLEIAQNTVHVFDCLVKPDLRSVGELAPADKRNSSDPYAFELAGESTSRSGSSRTKDEGKFTAQAAREGAAVAGALLQQVSFPTFVSSLIEGVFHAIVKSSIEQMEAYGRLVADVAKTLDQFRDENVSANQGRDHLIDQFPDLFDLNIDSGADGDSGPRVRVREGVDESAALTRVNSLPIDGGPISSLDDDTAEEKLVPAARTQLATSRQQLLATMIMMGINRIVVTDGKISAKILYDFQARDNMKFQKSATRFDYSDQYAYTQEGQTETDSEGSSYTSSRSKEGAVDTDYRGGSYYAKGTYKNTETPILKAASASQTSTDASLQTKASLAGAVEVNFKSDYFPLEKMADSFQISQIQNAAKPKTPVAGPGPTPTQASAPPPASATTAPKA